MGVVVLRGEQSAIDYYQALLERYREAQPDSEEQTIWLDPLLRSINAIASGMRNTG